MLILYPAVFHEEDGYWVEFPDLPGCTTEGDTLEEAFKNASEVLGLYIVSQYERDIALPTPSTVQSTGQPADGFISLVSTNPADYERRTQAVKKTLTIPEWLNEEAIKRNLNFSAILQQALKDEISSAG